ncbi:MAG: hypothetical protein JO154_24415 [Chitinophaga sp.]|uniref:carboxylesterase family protein n=1 Tax=Chitinophaga sp. TaxID=1869181 RepID=UPI0025BF03B1|nr:prolyl oligopeptidase family serine peptidase [Chitinophaga sp.]MBV8255761.1 hypothetical protein [Chitinophaga sp.]
MKKRKIKNLCHVLVLLTALFSCSKKDMSGPDKPGTNPPKEDVFDPQTVGITAKKVVNGGGNISDYLLYIPDGYNTRKDYKWPLVIFLHGIGEIGTNVDILRNVALPRVVKGQPFVMVAPQCTKSWWNGATLQTFYKEVVAKYHVDSNRVILTGLSMGGMATWDWICASPNNFAAAVPISGVGDPKLMGNVKKMPIWAFHSADDPTVSVNGSRLAVQALQAIGGNIKYTEYPTGGHDAWTRAYATPELYTWMLNQHK